MSSLSRDEKLNYGTQISTVLPLPTFDRLSMSKNLGNVKQQWEHHIKPEGLVGCL